VQASLALTDCDLCLVLFCSSPVVWYWLCWPVLPCRRQLSAISSIKGEEGTAPCPHLPVSKEEDPLCIAHLPFRQNLGVMVSRRRFSVHLTIPDTASLVRNLSPNPLPSAVQVEMKRILWKQQISLSDMTYCRVSYSCRFFNVAVDIYAQSCGPLHRCPVTAALTHFTQLWMKSQLPSLSLLLSSSITLVSSMQCRDKSLPGL
jgi:hypothetical protein